MYQLKSEIDKRMDSKLYNTIKNSEIAKIQRQLFKDNGLDTLLPYVSSSGSGGGGGGGGGGGEGATTPENIFDGSSVTEASFTLNGENDWKVLVVDYISNRSSFGTFTVSGEYYIGVLFASVLVNGINTLNDSSFNSLNKSGIKSDGFVYKNNVQVRPSYINFNGGTIAFTCSTAPSTHIKLGINSTKMRILSLTATPNKVFYAVKNGTMNFVKLPSAGISSTPIEVGTQIDLDAYDYTTAWGFGYGNGYPYNENKELAIQITQNTNSIQYYYGISHSVDTTYQKFPTPGSFSVPGNSNYIVVGNSSRSVNYGSNLGVANLTDIGASNNVYFFNNSFTQNGGALYKVFACGNGVNNFASRYLSSTSGTGLNPFIITNGTLLSFTVLNTSNFGYAPGRLGINQFDENLSGIAYNSIRFTLYKSFGTVTAHRFPRILSVNSGHQYFFELTVNDTSTSSIWVGILKSTTPNAGIESNGTLPSPELYMNIQTGQVGTFSLSNYASYPNTNPNSGIYTVRIEITKSGTSSFIGIGRNISQISVIEVTNMDYYSIVFWSNGGTSDTSQAMVTIHRLTTSNISYV